MQSLGGYFAECCRRYLVRRSFHLKARFILLLLLLLAHFIEPGKSNKYKAERSRKYTLLLLSDFTG
jgi:hypothetical protein